MKELQARGIRAHIYKSGTADFSNDGLSNHFHEVTIIGPGVPSVSPVTDIAPAVTLGSLHSIDGVTVSAAPVTNGNGTRWSMFGGAFLWSEDSRWKTITGTKGPIQLHDRYETVSDDYAIACDSVVIAHIEHHSL